LIAIVDYGMGNLRSVQKGLEKLGFAAFITDRPQDVLQAAGVILPGVGAFGDAMENLVRCGLDEALREVAASGRPFLGICLGLQLMFEESEENGLHRGLGIWPGRVIRLPAEVKIPHMGWNRVRRLRYEPILEGIADGTYFYFVHSYYVDTQEKGLVGAVADYGVEVPAVVSRGKVFGIQFHPEKSSVCGLRILNNFGEMVRNVSHTRY